MEWLQVDSVEELKGYGKTMKAVMLLIKRDLNKLFEEKRYKDKNTIDMITIRSNSWQGLLDKVVILREVIGMLDTKVKNCEGDYFNNKEDEYIFYLLELDGKQRADKLNITMSCYSDKTIAKRWRDSIVKLIHPDICKNEKAGEALVELNQLYEDMIRD